MLDTLGCWGILPHMTPTLHVRIYTQAASWIRSQARANRRSVGAETQFVVEQAMVRAELVERASVAVKLSRGEIARCKKCLGRKTKPCAKVTLDLSKDIPHYEGFEFVKTHLHHVDPKKHIVRLVREEDRA